MNVPPSPPPGGYYAVPPRKPGINGWQIAGIGCLGLFVLAALGGILLVRSFKEQLAHPNKNSIVGVGVLAGKATVDGVALDKAIAAYHQEKGQYPASLMTLVQEGRVDGKLLHNELDDNPSPGHVSWRYTKPAEGAPGSTPVLEEPYQITIGGSTQASQIIITLDGKSQAGASGRRQTPER